MKKAALAMRAALGSAAAAGQLPKMRRMERTS